MSENREMMTLVKYAGDYWVTLADFTQTRDTEGYSDHASAKSAIRTFVVKQNPDKYLAFRGEAKLKSIIQENKNNPLFIPDGFQGTRTALIHWSVVPALDERFKIDKKFTKEYEKFKTAAEKVIEEERVASPTEEFSSVNHIENRSAMIRSLRLELNRIDKDIERETNNREKVMQAINALESLEVSVQ